jgi:hypothetical protein
MTYVYVLERRKLVGVSVCLEFFGYEWCRSEVYFDDLNFALCKERANLNYNVYCTFRKKGTLSAISSVCKIYYYCSTDTLSSC